MKNFYQQLGLLLLVVVFSAQAVLAAPVPANNQAPAKSLAAQKQALAAVSKVRFSQTPEVMRIVFDVDKLPEYNVTMTGKPESLEIELVGATNKTGLPQIAFNDPAVKGLKFVDSGLSVKAVIELKHAVMYKVFTLKGPNRLVVDLIKVYDQKIQEEVAPGIKLTTLLRGRQEGPISAHVLDIDPKAGYAFKPVLSNEYVANLETVKSMADRTQAIAATNASYFSLSGDILGLLKMNGTIVSTAGLARTAMGITPEGTVFIDQVDYDGNVLLPDKTLIPIGGINCERGPNSLVLYNSYYDSKTNTNDYGIEYIVVDSKVTAINKGNSEIPSNGIVLSVHGTMIEKFSALKIGDTIKVNQTLGEKWDKAVHILSAGPRLVKNNSVYLTTKLEQFGSDVAGGKAPRTALGMTKDGHILLAVVDGRQYSSVGFTLLEMALFMQESGSVDAMNFDGGGSSEMVVNGTIVNKPSDGRERKVGNALIVVQQQREHLDN
ncbi:phosphodiester glycosidase family protein [Dendrosporobacter sp. 1207_IL3150]|uniref:phosphodiester glycosidase family protein n=1 Tax=Dendrosporobacter sp. 1207_IL3150 TaxID=3084054 RepID=UPI002FD8DD5C